MTGSELLKGVTVVEFGHSIAAPYTGLILAELGARVIKVEMPGTGDYCRDWGPPYAEDGAAIAFEAVNRGKESVTVDLKSEAEVERLRRFILAEADVVVHNLKFRALDRFGMSDTDLRAARPDLVYCHLGAFGATGPDREKPGYDPLMQAAGGLMSIIGEPGMAPQRIGVSIIDISTGMWAAIGILAALVERKSSGKGCVVNTSLFESALAWMATPIAAYLVSGKVPGPVGSGSPMIVPYQAFPSSDGYHMILAGNDGLFRKLCGVLDLAGLLQDDRFTTNGMRVANRDQLIPIIVERTKLYTRAQLAALLDEAGVPNGPINRVDQVLDSEQTKALGILQPAPEGNLRLVGLPLQFDGERPAFLKRAPKLGASNFVLDEAGIGNPSLSSVRSGL